MLFLPSFLSLKSMQNRFLKFTWAKQVYYQDFPSRSEFDVHPLPSDCAQPSRVPAPVGELKYIETRREYIYIYIYSRLAFQIIETSCLKVPSLCAGYSGLQKDTVCGKFYRDSELSRSSTHMTTSTYKHITFL